MTTRQEALATGKKRYHGAPCKKCGNTERYIANAKCTQCMGWRKEGEPLSPADFASKKRVAARRSGQKTYQGLPCKICGGTERYVRNSFCAECGKERRRVTKKVGHMIKKMASVVEAVRQHIMVSAVSHCHETRLAIAVFEQAAMDVFNEHESVSASRYLLGDMPGLQLCCIDPDWVHRLLVGNGLYDVVVERAKRRRRASDY